MISVTHITTGLDTGGSEWTLYRLLSRVDPRAFKMRVLSLTSIGALGTRILELGWPIAALRLKSAQSVPVGLIRLIRRLRQDPPDIVQTWMCHADLLGGLAAKAAGVPVVAWNLRQSDLRADSEHVATMLTRRACAQLSRRLPARIVCGSEAARRAHGALGYDVGKMIVIRNGIALPAADMDARRSLRAELGIAHDALLAGRVGRFHPMKDYGNFVAAAALVHRHDPEVHFLACGPGVHWQNPQLSTWIRSANLQDRFHLLGCRDDISRINSALDVGCSSSSSEGFPNVIAEAMASGTPVVATDVGDSAEIVGETGLIVPPRDTPALAAALTKLLELPPGQRHARGRAARERVRAQFGIRAMMQQYQELYEGLANVRR